MKIIDFFRALVANFRAELSERRKAKHKQHWQAAPVGGGGTIQLGYMTEAEALIRLRLIKGDRDPVAYVDFERGFIAFGKHPDEKSK
jgi:hypothetical protein